MKNVKLTDEQIKNLFLLLDRVEIKGIREATALVSLVSTFSNAEEITDTSTKGD